MRDLLKRRQRLFLSASESAAAPVSPIWLWYMLQRGEEGKECSLSSRRPDRPSSY
jgi:hypothetical protein